MPTPVDALDLAEAISRRVDIVGLTERLVRALSRTLGAAWTTQGELFLRAFTSRSYAQAAIDTAFARAAARTAPSMTTAIIAAATQSMVLGARHGVPPGLAPSFTVKHPDAVKYLDAVGANRVTRIDADTRDRLRRIVRDGLARGDSYAKTADVIRDTFRGFSTPSPLRHIRDRAELVAVTETGNAYTAGALIQARRIRDLDFRVEKRWLTAGDMRVDDLICRTNERAGWIDVDDDFPSGHDGPTGHPGCRCAVMTRTLV